MDHRSGKQKSQLENPFEMKAIINPKNALVYLLKCEFFRQCGQKKVIKEGEELIEYTHPKFNSFEEWLIANSCAIPESAVLGADGQPLAKA